MNRVLFLAYYYYCTGQQEFELHALLDDLEKYGCGVSNRSRVKMRISKSKYFCKSTNGFYKLTTRGLGLLDDTIGYYFEDNETIVSKSEILDESMFGGKRGYLDKLIIQINSCYAHNCYDASAVLMRRLLEVLLIESYEKHGIGDEIKDLTGKYLMLEKIVAKAKTNSVLNLSRSKHDLDVLRDVGNFSAHRIAYNARKKDIDDIQLKYRVILEELFYKAGFLN